MHAAPHKLVTWTVFALVIGGYALMALHFPLAYIWATYEDLIGEWSQTFFFLAAAILSVLAARPRTRYRWFFILLAIACSYVVLEEISWGQRIFGFETPEFLKARNLQGEANLHNLFTGPHKTFLKDLISIGVALGLVMFGLGYPMALAYQWKPALWLDRVGLPGSPLMLSPYFIVAAYFELKPFSFNEAEVAELLIGSGLAMFALHYLLAVSRGLPTPVSRWERNDSLVLGRWLILMTTSVILLAGVTTVAFYSSPANKARIDNRIENGVEKFARRYERYDRCDIANQLYDMLLAAEPDRVFILRKKAACYRTLGQAESFDKTLEQAIAIDLRILAADPWRASVNQSLVRSYRLAGDDERAQVHLDNALEIGVSRIMSRPESASAAYSYARTLQLAYRHEEALEQFTRAYELKPTSSRYRKAYFAARAAARR